MEKVVKKEPYGSVTRQKSVHQMKSRNNTICLSSGTGLDSKLLYDEGKWYSDILKVFNLSYIYSIFQAKFLIHLMETGAVVLGVSPSSNYE